MRLPLGRPLRYGDHAFVQPVRGTRDPIPRFVQAQVIGEGTVPLLDDLDALASESFVPSRLHPRIRAFFETPCTGMTVDWLRWEPWALGLASVYVPVAARLGNLRVLDRVEQPRPMSSSVRALRWPDGSTSREWIRTLSGTSQLFYAAALRPWRTPEKSYFSMAFPFGSVHLMVLLRLRQRGELLELSTRNDTIAGTYTIVPGERHFVALPGPPTHEVLSYELADDGLEVLHEDFLGSRRTFAMRYRLDGV